MLATATAPSYSRGQEFEADQMAVRLLRKAGYENANEVLHATLQILLDRYGDTGGRTFDSHPATSERMVRLKK
jgi:predicted Zn-dependent protease